MHMTKIKRDYKSIFGVSFLAFLLWFMVKLNRSYEYTINVPIRYSNLDTNLVFKYPQTKEIRVQFAGKGRDLLKLPFYNLEYQIDLSNTDIIFELDLAEYPEYLTYPGDLNVAVKSIIQPRTLIVELDRKVKRMVPIAPPSTNNFRTAEGYLLVKLDLRPDSILIEGPRELFEKTSRITLEQKNFTDLSRPFETQYKINQIGDYNATYSPRIINVFFDVQRLAYKWIGGIPVEVLNKPPNYQVVVLPPEADVYVKGPEKVLAVLGPDDFRIEIDYKRVWRAGIKKVPAKLISNAEVIYTETRPAEFELIPHKGQVE
jgi:YbbR domain-containing protein